MNLQVLLGVCKIHTSVFHNYQVNRIFYLLPYPVFPAPCSLLPAP
ncbi:hypothetical protein [Moorena producens]|nr:hypothetical protein [Moorena producens]